VPHLGLAQKSNLFSQAAYVRVVTEDGKIDRTELMKNNSSNMPTRRFFVADISAAGELKSTTEYTYEHLERIPGAADLIVSFSTHMYRSPQEFEMELPQARSRLRFRWWSSAETAGIATLRCEDQLASLGLLACGLNRDADRLTFEAFQTHLLRELHGTPFEPAFALLDIAQRPLVAVVPFMEPPNQVDQLLMALADRCFAAAYFRYHHLA
jgi:hypothetical protein